MLFPKGPAEGASQENHLPLNPCLTVLKKTHPGRSQLWKFGMLKWPAQAFTALKAGWIARNIGKKQNLSPPNL